MSYSDRFQRTQGILSPEQLQRLAGVHIVVAGVGGAGGQVALDLARLGVGYLTLADFDVYERHNMNRQAGSFESTLGQPKIDVIARMCQDINPDLRVRRVHEGVSELNCRQLLQPSDAPEPAFVIEVIDLAGVSAKVCLHGACRELGLTVMTGIMLGFGGSVIVFRPDAPGYERLFVRADGTLDLASAIPRIGSYVLQDYLDRCFTGRGHAPTCVIGATTASALMVAQIVRGLLHGKESMTAWPEYLYVDFIDQIFVRDVLPSSGR